MFQEFQEPASSISFVGSILAGVTMLIGPFAAMGVNRYIGGCTGTSWGQQDGGQQVPHGGQQVHHGGQQVHHGGQQVHHEVLSGTSMREERHHQREASG
jgi:hypothetical protein